MAAGKSTLASELAAQDDAILLVQDEWLEKLFPGEVTDIPGFVKYSSRLKDALAPLAVYFEAFVEHDPVRRGELPARCLTVAAEIWGPKRLFAGHAAIAEKFVGFHKNWPACRLALTSGLNAFGNLARFSIAIVSAGGLAAATGYSIIELALDGRISRVLPFWDSHPPIPESWPGHLAYSGPR